VKSETRFNEDCLFGIWETEFEEEGAGVYVFVRGVGRGGYRRCFGGGRILGIEVRRRGRGCRDLLVFALALWLLRC
jgi:hypothetical protein